MIIKLTAIKDTMLGASRAKQVVGTNVTNGEEWSKAFFSNQKDLADQLEEFGIGDMVAVELEQKGKFWNIKGFHTPTQEELEKAKKSFTPKEAYKKPAEQFRRQDGGSRGDDTNRSAAIYLAREIVAMSDEPDDKDAEQVAERIIYISNTFIYPYIKDGKVPEVRKAGRKKDPLDPPEIA